MRGRGDPGLVGVLVCVCVCVCVCVVLGGATLGARGAEAASQRVAISGYAWSAPVVVIDRGERVVWDWVGPDLFHSVTGAGGPSAGLDSDPGRQPLHRLGDEFSLSFGAAGSYEVVCKLHASVRGTVVVSDRPGDPASDPGPKPAARLDLRPPTIGAVRLGRAVFGGARGVALSARVSEAGRIDAEYFRLDRRGRRHYAGFKAWPAHIGINRVRLGARWKRFGARPGRYEVELRAVDAVENASPPVRKRFTILARARARARA